MVTFLQILNDRYQISFSRIHPQVDPVCPDKSFLGTALALRLLFQKWRQAQDFSGKRFISQHLSLRIQKSRFPGKFRFQLFSALHIDLHLILIKAQTDPAQVLSLCHSQAAADCSILKFPVFSFCKRFGASILLFQNNLLCRKPFRDGKFKHSLPGGLKLYFILRFGPFFICLYRNVQRCLLLLFF